MSADMPVFILKAKDVLSVWTIETYRRECVRYGLIEQAEQVDLALDEINKHMPVGAS